MAKIRQKEQRELLRLRRQVRVLRRVRARGQRREEPVRALRGDGGGKGAGLRY